MDFIIDAITEWIKDFLIEAITGNLSNMFGDVNTKVATIAGEVGKTPEQWNSGVFSMIHSLSESVIVPIAGLVIAAVLSYELIRMVIDRNNMHDFDTFIFFKWIIKAGIAAYVVSHTFDFIIAIFEVAQTMVQQSAGVIDANASIDISSALASITTELETKGLGELFALMLETWVVSFAMTVMGALITIILYGRMIEIYIYASVGPLPFATFANHEWGNIGTNYVRGLVALGLQQIQGLEGDLAVLQAHPQPDKEHFSITVAGQTYTERKAAGQAIIDACTKMTDVSQRVELGEYRGFPMTLWADTATQKFQVTMKQNLSHTIELGSDPVGNIARLDNALAAIAENLEQHKGKLENLTAQMEEAKLEVKRPFPQEQELAEKSARLNVLRIALNMDGKSTGKRERDKEEF